MRPHPGIASLSAALCVLAWAGMAGARQPDEPRLEIRAPSYRVIQVIGADVFVDVRAAVLGPRTKLEVYREVTVQDPSTQEPLSSRLRIGSLHVHRPGDRFSVARAPRCVEVQVGDQVAIVVAPLATAAPPLKHPLISRALRRRRFRGSTRAPS